ncbi:MAG TPA: ROK family protein [Acidobacteriaceae bacterium]|nr:ROK family protein [Acidobacteriaceae bacterium]
MAQQEKEQNAGPVTLAIDIGGTGLKMMSLDARGEPVSERLRVPTPDTPTPKAVLEALTQLKARIRSFDRVSVGFPGVIKQGKTLTAVNLHKAWVGFALQEALEQAWAKPVRVANDCAVQGYGAIHGKGVEMVLTLGTGLGSSIFTDGHLCPGLELGHHPWRKKTYEDYLGKRGLKKYGGKRWNDLLEKAIAQTSATFNWDILYIGGGNSKKITHKFVGGEVKLIPNEDGLLGGVALWKDQELFRK